MKIRILSKLAKEARWGLQGRSYGLEPMENYVERQGIQEVALLDRALISGSTPRFFGGADGVDLTLYRGQQIAPRVTLTEFRNVTTIGRSELVIHNNVALYPRPFDPSRYSFMLESEGRARVNLKRGRIRMLFRSKTLKVDSAISLLGQCNGNYAHWVLEVLTRLALLKDNPDLQDVPLLIDTPIHDKMLDALAVLNPTGREVIFVRNAQKVRLRKLFYLTSPSFTPPETRQFFTTGTIAPPDRDQFQFSANAIASLREFAIEECSQYVFLKAKQATSLTCGPRPDDARFIFLRRSRGTTGNGRHVSNEAAIEAYLRTHGFCVLDSYELSFEEQVMSLQNTEIVVSAIGASCANLVFCKPGLSVVLLSPRYPNASWFYWVNLMLAAGHKLYLVLGPQVASSRSTIYHKDFRISLKLINEAIEMAKAERA